MDNPKYNSGPTCIEWFFGYGGNHLGIKRVLPGLRTLAVCEREGYGVANMVAKMEAGLLDAAPIWTDVRTFPSERFAGLVDLFVGSYPCQPFSHAGQRKGKEDPRHLWPYVLAAIRVIRPRCVFFENVEGHITLGLREVLADLVDLGYRVENSRGIPTWGIFSAAEIGSSHQRKRVFIYAELADGARGGFGELREPSGGNGLADWSHKELAYSVRGLGSTQPWEQHQERREVAGGASDETAMAYSVNGRSQERRPESTGKIRHGGNENLRPTTPESSESMADSNSPRRPQPQGDVGEQRGRAINGGEASGFVESSTNPERRCGISGAEAGTGSDGERRRRLAESGRSVDMAHTERAERGTLPERGNVSDGSNARRQEAPSGAGKRSGEDVRDARLPRHPPGPGDIEGWRRVLAIDPTLAPAIEQPVRGMASGNTEVLDGRQLATADQNRTDRLRLCGNGVHPATAEKAFRVLYARMRDQ